MVFDNNNNHYRKKKEKKRKEKLSANIGFLPFELNNTFFEFPKKIFKYIIFFLIP